MKRAPGTGGIRKLSGKRRKKYQAVVTAGRKWVDGKLVQDQRSIGVFETRREAQAALEEYNRLRYNIHDRNLTFENTYNYIMENENLKESTRKFFISVYPRIEPLHKMRMVDIRKKDLDLVGRMNTDVGKSTQANIKTVVSRCFAWAMENDIIIKNYAEFLTFPEYKESQKKSSYGEREIACVIRDGDPLQKILLYTGMRIQELIDMKTSEVYEENGILCFHVVKSKTKAGVRVIPVHSAIMDLIDLNTEYVIDPHLNYKQHRRRYEAFNVKHGIHRTFHELRHTFSTYAKSCGMDDFYRRALLGHAQEGITDQVYTDPQIAKLKEQIELLRYDVM